MQQPSCHPVVLQFNDWTRGCLPRLNEQLIRRHGNLVDLVYVLNGLLAQLPPPEVFGQRDIRCLLVLLGIWGSSVGRHALDRHATADSESAASALAALRVGPNMTFRRYFSALAATEQHPERDAYASLIRWNAPTVHVRWHGQTVGSMVGCFDDGEVRTYTDDAGEKLIIELFKKSETLERVVNEALAPLWLESLPSQAERCERLMFAASVLAALWRLMLAFPNGDSRGQLTPARFIDVFRQFAVHWDRGDVPPSGPQDVEFIKRDLMLGTGGPGYVAHVRRIYPGLLAFERTELEPLFDRPSLPERLLTAAGVSNEAVRSLDRSTWQALLDRHPEIAACSLCLRMNARVSSAHLMLAKSFLFRPAGVREPDAMTPSVAPVPNEAGITGLAEAALERLHARRLHHLLEPLERCGVSALRSAARAADLDAVNVDADLRSAGSAT